MNEVKEKRPVGRPRLSEDQKQKYQRLAVYPHTHQKLKDIAKKKHIYLIDLIDQIVEHI